MKSSRGAESPIRVVDLVFSSGESRKWEIIEISSYRNFFSRGSFLLRSVQTIAFNLPNDERVRKEKGAKKVRGVINIVAWISMAILFCQYSRKKCSNSKNGEIKNAVDLSFAATLFKTKTLKAKVYHLGGDNGRKCWTITYQIIWKVMVDVNGGQYPIKLSEKRWWT